MVVDAVFDPAELPGVDHPDKQELLSHPATKSSLYRLENF
jgi:hypothetical protein